MKRDKNSPNDEFLFDQFNKQNNDSAEKIEEEIYNIKSKGTPTDIEEKVPQNVTTNLTKTKKKKNKNHLSLKKSKRIKNQNKKKNNMNKSEYSKKLSQNNISAEEEITLDTPQKKHEISDNEMKKSIKLFLQDKKIEEREEDNSIKILNLKDDKNNQNKIKPISKNENEINIMPSTELEGDENNNIPKDNINMSEQKKNGNNNNLNNKDDMSISDQGENLNNNNQNIENSMSLSEPEQHDNENFQNSHLINDINNINNELNHNDINYSETFYPNGDGEEIFENNTNAFVYANNEPNSNINELLPNSDDTYYVTVSIEVNNNNVFYNEYEENIMNLSDMLNNDMNLNQEDNDDVLNESQIVDINVNAAGCSWKKGK